MDIVWKKVRKTDSVFVHSSRVHAYFSVIWVFVYFVLRCGLVKAEMLELLSRSQNKILETQEKIQQLKSIITEA